MKLKTCTTMLAVAAGVVACKSTGVDRAEQTAAAMRALYTSVEAAPAKIDAVSASLTELAKAKGDMREQYETFGNHVDALLSHRDQIRSLRVKVDDNREVFRQEWQKRLLEIKDEDLRNRAMERQRVTLAEFAKVSETANAARQAFEPWINTVVDVRTYLENDLNPEGVASVSDKVKEVNQTAGKINKSVAELLSKVEDLAKKIEATKPPPPTKK